MGEIIPRPVPPIPMPFTGERLTTDYGGQTEIEHMHRYLLAREWCRGKDVLDVASGEGYGTALLAQVARTAVGIEIAPEAVAHAAGAYAREGLRYVQGDARAIPEPDAAFDVVVSFETIEHFSEQEQFLDEVRRVLRPGGLLIVSTPDRDNYSPADMPANPYHVRELTGGEFETLLQSRFAEVSLLLQRPVFGSVLFPTAPAAAMPMCFERRGSDHIEASAGLARPQYLVAFASDKPIFALPPSVYVETGRLGMLNPVEADAQLQATKNALEAERIRAAAEIGELTTQLFAAQSERETWVATAEAERQELRARISALTTTLEEQCAELAGSQGEAKGLLAAAEMTERAFALLRQDMLSANQIATDLREANGRLTDQMHAFALLRQDMLSANQIATDLREANGRLTDQVRRIETELVMASENARRSDALLANTLASHSWRLTGPLRWISSRIYRRS